MKKNHFIKPNDQSQACLDFGMAGNGRIKSNLLLFLMVFLPLMASAKTLKINGIWYKLSDAKAEVLKCPETTSGAVMIPKFVTYEGVKYQVTSIGKSAFQECLNVTSVTLPKGLKHIGDFAFCFCESLTFITIPGSVTSIGCSAFDSSGLTSIVIPKSVKSIGDFAFSDCGNLTSISIGKGVTRIGNAVFRNCHSLESVSISKKVTHIGDYAFRGCGKLYAITIPKSVTHIGKAAFCYCTYLNSINIPNNVTYIGDNAFSDCYNLRTATIGNGVISIGEGAFYDCKSLESISIGRGVTSIGKKAFNGCQRLSGVHINDVAAWCNITFRGGSNPLVFAYNLYVNEELIEHLIIPEGVTAISSIAFENCDNLISVTIPKSMKSIGSFAFSICNNLKHIYCHATTPPEINRIVEKDAYSSVTIHVPNASLEAYWEDKSWKEFKNIVPIDHW